MCLLAALGLSCCTGAALWLPWTGFSWQGLLFSQSAGSWARGRQRPWRAGSKEQAHVSWLTGLVAPPHAEPSRPRARTGIPYITRQTLITGPPGKPYINSCK